MALKVDWPDFHFGFWAALGVMLAFLVVMLVKRLVGAARGKAKNA